MKPLAKVAVGIGVAGVVGVLFVRSVTSSRSEPYTVPPAQLSGWSLVIDGGNQPTDPVLMLRGPGALVEGLSHQIFKRAMESLSSPGGAYLPLLTKGEFDRALGGRVAPEQILAAARAAGLGAGAVIPRCLAYRRSSDPGSTRQVYFLTFDLPAFARFRQEVATLSGGSVGFDPAAFSPTVIVALSQSTVDQWGNLKADPEHDCVAPITTAP